ncbi:MAG TPA: hypothetical protein ENJ53_02475 [Phaeodactylibacter sp.]|nr:hypothetical protein [Phaeodactylibacter sp.]
MSKISKDLLWKGIIKVLFNPFLHYFYKEYVDEIDFEKGFEFLDKELQTMYAQSDSKNRQADLLVKVWLKNGKEKWILIHIEVQGYRDDEFSERVFNMYSRIRDRYGKPVSVLIIYTDDSPSFHPKEFREDCLGTVSHLQFSTYKLLENPPSKSLDPDNPFSIVMEIAWYALKKNKLSEENYVSLGKEIVRKLIAKNFDHETIRYVVEFLRHYVGFENSELFGKFSEVIDNTLKIEKNMGILEVIRKHKEEEIREDEIEKVIKNALDEGCTLDLIATITNLSIKEIKAIIKKNGWDKK